MRKKYEKKMLFILFLMLFFPIFNVFAVTKVSCGNVTDIPKKIPELTSFAMTLVQILVPVILVVTGSLDLFKGITASKEDEIKKGQQIFIKRLIIGAIIFFVIVVVKFFISIVADSNSANLIECVDCFFSNNCNVNTESTDSSMDDSNTTDSSMDDSNVTDSNIDDSNITDSSMDDSNITDSNIDDSNITDSNMDDSNVTDSSIDDSNIIDSNTDSIVQDNKLSNLFIGDSRTVGMCGTYKLCENYEYIAEVGMGYSWFIKTAIPKINSKISSNNYNIIILMGVNDVGQNGSSVANKYYNKIYELATTTWKNQNIIFVSVNPVQDGKSYAYMSGVNSFNSEIKSKINSSNLSNLKYCDTVSKLNMKSIDVGDGLHYNKKGYIEIYNIIKNNCLK